MNILPFACRGRLLYAPKVYHSPMHPATVPLARTCFWTAPITSLQVVWPVYSGTHTKEYADNP